MTTENTIDQPARFRVGQLVKCQDTTCAYLTHTGRVAHVEKGEEVWKFYVSYNGGSRGRVHFAEEMQSIGSASR